MPNSAVELHVEAAAEYDAALIGIFTLIYRERLSGDIQVVAVAHTSRKPGYWRQRL
jgi:hypothetical protein